MMEIKEEGASWVATHRGSKARIWLDGSHEYRIHVSDPCGALADPKMPEALKALESDGDVIRVRDDRWESCDVPRVIIEAAVERLRELASS